MSTIIALSTPPFVSAIAIIRLSGEKSLALTKQVFSGFRKEVKERVMTYGTLQAGEYKDDCMCVYFAAPHSYTGEDMVEINCHGSPTLANGIISWFLQNGAVSAERGEFTRRAFVNGKMDLTQSEAVIDMIEAQSQAELKNAYDQLGGALLKRIQDVQKKIITAIAAIEVSLDYPEEEIEETTEKQSAVALSNILDELHALKGSYESGSIVKNGIKVALVGEPNVGKSKILNSLLGYERAIVTDIAGTTRDTLSESYTYEGLRFVVTDTAGIRETADTVEKIGVERAKQEASKSDVIVVVTQAGERFEPIQATGRVIKVENKIDLFSPKSEDSVKVSALTGEGIRDLKKAIYEAVAGRITVGGGMITNARQLSAVEEAILQVNNALSAVGCTSLDMVSSELSQAYRSLGKITGVSSSDEIVGEIFSRFCVGK